jgi:DNA-binding CsgD family transcriptional regulator
VTAPLRVPRGFDAVDGVRRALAAARTVEELFCVAATQAREFGGFGRAIVLDVADGHLRAEITGELPHEPSEVVRRRVIAEPIPMGNGSVEADLVRGAPPGRNAESVAERVLGLQTPAIVPVTPESAPVALLVADRPARRPDGGGSPTVVAHLMALSLTALVLRRRIVELSTEIRYLTASTHALLHEAQNAPISLPRDHGQGLAFARVGVAETRRREEDGLLTLREREIMDRVVAGRSNAEIAADLHLSADTVKTHVGRLLRKLGATNRVGAVVAYLERQREPSS